MAQPPNTGTFEVTINGSELNSDQVAAVQSVRVETQLNLPAMFNLTLSTYSNTSDDWQFVDLDTFSPGATATVAMGLDMPKTIFSGNITGLEPHFGDYSTLVVRGYDGMFKLHFGTHLRTFLDQSDSQIAEQVAESAGLTAEVDSSEITYPFVLQNNRTNFDFLQERRRLVNFEMLANGDTLHFRRSAQGQSPVTKLLYKEDFSAVDLNLGVLTQGSSVTVFNWSAKEKQVIAGSADTPPYSASMGGDASGFGYTSSFPPSPLNIFSVNIPDVQAGTVVAKAVQGEELNLFIEGHGQARGNPNIQVGTNLELEGIGNRFSGPYYVTGAVHHYAVDSGYQTQFRLRRTGI